MAQHLFPETGMAAGRERLLLFLYGSKVRYIVTFPFAGLEHLREASARAPFAPHWFWDLRSDSSTWSG